MSQRSVTEIMAEYAENSKYEDLPDEVVELVKYLLIDTIGCAFGGYATEAGKMIVDFSKSLGGNKESTIIGDSSKVPAKHAAFANAQIARILDFDETYKNSGHPASSVVNTALAVGELVKASGQDIINCIATGYEVSTRVIDAINPTPEKWVSGVYPFGTPDFLGPPVVAAKLFRLKGEKFYNAFVIGASNARLPIMGKAILPPLSLLKCAEGWQAEQGIEAALLAEKGFTGIRDVLDGERGFWAAAASDRCDWKELTEKLGQRYNIPSMSLKAQPVCRWVHPAIEAAMELVSENNLQLSEISFIKVKSHTLCTRSPYNSVNPFFKDIMNSMAPAQFSIPWGLTMALFGIPVGAEWYSDDKFRNSEVLSFAKKIKVEADEEADRAHAEDPLHTVAKVMIEIKHGKVYRKRVDYAKGDPQRRLTKEEILDKFNCLTKSLVSKEKSERLVDALLSLEKVADVSKIPENFF